MKTLLLISHSSSLTGGGEEDFLRLLKFLKGKYNLIGIFPEGKKIEEYKKYVSEYLIIPDRMFPFTNFNLKSYAGYFIKAFPKIKLITTFLSDKKIDLVYIHSSVCLYEALIVNKLKIPYVISIREFINPLLIRKQIYNFYLKSANKIIVISKLVEKEFTNSASSIDKIKLIYPGIEETEINQSDWDNDIIILNIGNMFYQKGQHKVIEAISRIKYSNKNVILKIIGAKVNEKYFNYLSSLIQKYKLNSKVILTGELPRDKVLQEIANSSVVIISSFQEGFSLVLLEALSLKKPVISTRVGVIPEVIIDNENGLLYDYENSDMLAEKIDLLLNDDSLYHGIAEKGYVTYTKKFDLNECLKNHEEVFQHILIINEHLYHYC